MRLVEAQPRGSSAGACHSADLAEDLHVLAREAAQRRADERATL